MKAVTPRFFLLAVLTLFLPLVTSGQVMAADPPGVGDVVINEYVANSSTEWVELYNTTEDDLDISGHYIDDIPSGGGAPKVIPASTIIPAGGYYVLEFSSFLNNGGDDVRFLDPTQTVVLDSTSYTSSTAENSYFRFPDGGSWMSVESDSPTKGETNNAMFDEPWEEGTFEIRNFDIGQGDSQLIIFPSGYTILIDVREASWNSGKGAALVASKIEAITGGTHVNVGVLSHLHLDHIGYAGYGGFWGLIETHGITFDKIIDRDAGEWVDGSGGGIEDDLCDPDLEIVWHNAGTVSGTSRNWLCYATNPANTNIYSIREIADVGSTTQIAPPDEDALVTIVQADGDGVYMVDQTTPIQGDHTALALPPSENNYSIGIKVRYGLIDYATAGDSDGEYATSTWGYTYNDVEAVLADRFGQVDVLRVNHHGSSHSSNQYYVDTLNPDASVISCGANNTFGHPAQDVIDRLLDTGDLYITNLCDPTRDYGTAVLVNGDVILRSTNGVNYTIDGTPYVATDPAPPVPVLFAGWDFEDQTRDPSVDLNSNAEAAPGGGLSGESYTAGNPGGTSGKAWSFTHWSLTGSPGSTKYVEFLVDLTNYENVTLAFSERRSGTGPLAFEIHYSLTGSSFTQIAATVTSIPNNTNWRNHLFDLSGLNAQISGEDTVYFRIYGYSASGSTGTWRIDDVAFVGE